MAEPCLDNENAMNLLDELLSYDLAAQRRETAEAVRAMPVEDLRSQIEEELERFSGRLADYLAMGKKATHASPLIPARQEIVILEALGESSLRLAGLQRAHKAVHPRIRSTEAALDQPLVDGGHFHTGLHHLFHGFSIRLHRGSVLRSRPDRHGLLHHPL